MSLFGDVLGALASKPVGRNRRVSSNEQPNWNDGNFDMTSLAPGASIEMPLLDGPGVITHIWVTSHAGSAGELDSLTLRIYWDGRAAPDVESPLGDFFAVGHGRPALVESFPVQVSPTGSLTCFWRMPFHESARIVVTNDNPDRWAGLYWQVDWTQVDALPEGTGRFCARYRQEFPASAGRDYLIADIEGSGKYVGTVKSLTNGQDGWFGEGDDFFYIDGETVPSLQGTGSEDYFNDAWGFRPRASTWFGQPTWQGYRAGDSGVFYRWHVLDPVEFRESLRVTIEHKGNREMSEDGFYVERPDFVSSVAFWYQTGPAKAWDTLAPYPARRVPWVTHNLVKRLRSAELQGGGSLVVDSAGLFGGRPTLAWDGAQPGDSLSLPFELAESGRYAVRADVWSGGAFAVSIDGLSKTDLGTTADETGADLLIGTMSLPAGRHSLTIRCIAPARLAVETLRLLLLPPEAFRAIKTDNEAHFVRLGIGRAIYAFRLVEDRLPSSLHELVETGFMDARYLEDENGVPLEGELRNGAVHVASTGPNPWTHTWQGLDARR